jgi:CotS family spore coat protein
MVADFEETLNCEGIQNIIEQYGLHLKAYKPCRRVWRVETDAGYKYLKRSKLSRADIWFIYEAQEYLYRNAFDYIPRLTWSQFKEPFVNEDNNLYVLTDWYFGMELDFNLLMDLKQASHFLAEFHLKSSGFKPSQAVPQRTCWLNWPQRLEQHLEQLQDFRRLATMEKESSVFCRLYLRNFEPYYKQAVSSYQALLKSPYPAVAHTAAQNLSFCHHDYSGRNLLRTFHNRLLLVDFDYCLLDLRIHDLINLLVRNLKHNEWRQDLCSFIIQEYQAISPLTPEEMEVMYVLLCWPQDFWQVGLQYFYEKLPWPKERFIKKLQHKIDYRAARDKFLQDFPKSYGINNVGFSVPK